MVNEGQTAIDFSLPNQDGQLRSLRDFHGKVVLLYFYPKDDTPGCTAEACSLWDGMAELLAHNAVVLGVSPDKPESHQKFRSKYDLPFELLADPEHTVLELYGAWGEKNLYGKKSIGVLRSTVIIDAAGVIRKIIRKVDTKNHSAQVLAYLA